MRLKPLRKRLYFYRHSPWNGVYTYIIHIKSLRRSFNMTVILLHLTILGKTKFISFHTTNSPELVLFSILQLMKSAYSGMIIAEMCPKNT